MASILSRPQWVNTNMVFYNELAIILDQQWTSPAFNKYSRICPPPQVAFSLRYGYARVHRSIEIEPAIRSRIPQSDTWRAIGRSWGHEVPFTPAVLDVLYLCGNKPQGHGLGMPELRRQMTSACNAAGRWHSDNDDVTKTHGATSKIDAPEITILFPRKTWNR